jgi:hypothetical protein
VAYTIDLAADTLARKRKLYEDTAFVRAISYYTSKLERLDVDPFYVNLFTLAAEDLHQLPSTEDGSDWATFCKKKY